MSRLVINRKTLVVLAAVMLSQFVTAQQDLNFSQFMFNKAALNPAFTGGDQTATGTTQNWHAVMVHRQQWLDFPSTTYTRTGDDAAFANFNKRPVTTTFNLTKAFGRKSIADPNPLAFGIVVAQEQLGFENRLSFQGSLSYHIELSSEAMWRKGNKHLFFGINGGIKQFGLGSGNFYPHQADDQTILTASTTATTPDMGAGIMFKNEGFYLAASATHLIETNIEYSSYTFGVQRAQQVRGYYFMGGLFLPLRNKEGDVTKIIAPAALVKYTQGVPVQFNGNIRLTSANNDAWWFGFSYRQNDAASVLAGINLAAFGDPDRENKKMLLGYSFDFTTSAINSSTVPTLTPNGPYNAGTHEIMLTFDINTEKELKTKYDGGRNGLRER